MSVKGALGLLSGYGGDSSDDEVPGCRFSTKRMHKDEDDEPSSKRFERLPVPAWMKEKTEEFMEDSSLHEGRVRTFPHERGNWASYVYIPVELNEGLQNLISTIIHMGFGLEMKPVEDLHISLTKTVILRHHWIDPFISTVKSNMVNFSRFILMFNNINVYCNEERTRTFIGLQIKTGYDTLTKIINCLDNCLQEFKLPTFYENPSFHLSIAWCLGDCEEKLHSVLPNLNTVLQEVINQFPQENWYICVDTIMCKTGNKLFQFRLT